MKIHKLLDSSIAEPEKFNKDVHAIIEKERNNKLNAEKKHKEEIDKNKELQETNKDLLKVNIYKVTLKNKKYGKIN